MLGNSDSDNDNDENTTDNVANVENKRKVLSKWTAIPIDITQEERMRIIAKTIEISINIVNDNHVYCFNNKFYKQMTGGATGLRLM